MSRLFDGDLELTIGLTGAEAAEQGLQRVDRAVEGVEASAKSSATVFDQLDAKFKSYAAGMQTSGVKAQDYAQKIVQVGGATKLTAEEQRKATDALKAGTDEYERMGKTVPGIIRKVSTELAGVQTAAKVSVAETEALASAQTVVSGTSSKLLGITGLLGGATLAAGAAFVAAVPVALSYASSLDKVATASGAGVEGAQRLENIAVRTGTQVQNLAQGTSELARRVADGEKSALGAMDRLGISTDNFLRLRADDKFIAVASSLGRVADAGERAALAKDLFSNWQEVFPALTSDVDTFADSIQTMSEDQIQDLVKVQREWETLKLEVKRTITELVAMAATPIEFVVRIVWTRPNLDEDLQHMLERDGVGPGRKTDIELPQDLTNMAPSPFGFGAPEPVSPNALKSGLVGGRTLAEQLHDTYRDEPSKSVLAQAAREREELARAQLELQGESDRVFAGVLLQLNGRSFTGGGVAPSLVDRIEGTAALPQGLITLNAGTEFERQNLAKGPVDIKPAAHANIDAASGGPRRFTDDLFASVPNAIQAAIAGGGSKLQAAGSAIGTAIFGRDSGLSKTISGGISSLFGKDSVLTKTLSSAVPVIGALVGPAIAGLQKLFGKSEESSKVSPVRDKDFGSLATRLGGSADNPLAAINPAVLAATGSLKLVEDVLHAKTVDQYNAAWGALTTTLDGFRKSVEDARSSLTTVTGKLEHITEITPAVRDGLAAAINAKNPQDFAAALTNVNGLLDAAAQKHQHLKDLAAEYNLSLKDMGRSFAQGEVDEKATKLSKDFKDLIDAGANADSVLHGMASSYSTLVQTAKDTGTELPNSMKPTLEKLITMGELVDKDGKKLTDLDGLNFGDTLQDRLKDIKDVVNDLKGAIENLAAAFRGLPTSLPALPTVTTSPAPRGQVDTSGMSGSPDANGGWWDSGANLTSHTGSIIRAGGLERFHTGGALLRKVGWSTLSQQLGLAGDERAIIGQVGEGILNRTAMGNMAPQQFHALNRGVDPQAIFTAAQRGGVVGPRIAPPAAAPAKGAQVDTRAIVDAIAALEATIATLPRGDVHIQAIDTQSIRDAVKKPGGILDVTIETLARQSDGRDQNMRNALRIRK